MWVLAVLACTVLAKSEKNQNFWEGINDDSIEDVMKHSPQFKQMIMTSCEQITLGRAAYPKQIPKDTVDKLCTKMYPPFTQREGAKGGTKKLQMPQNMNTIIVGVVALAMVAYVWTASAP